ncbi:MAG TPA: Npt1/Npt2 family nucleotide transporter [Polyangiaceae bacterium]|nr:Npt1/Npt2 family nucleotide transporter [Polyangiaceae bacterium]
MILAEHERHPAHADATSRRDAVKPSLGRRALASVVELYEGETATALLMFSYSFLAMAGYNVIKPATRSKFIAGIGADNLPYMLLLAGLGMGFVMQGYSSLLRKVPRRWVIPGTQLVLVACLFAFWFLFRLQENWVSAVFYFWGLTVGLLLISQFWTLANHLYDPRQAKRIFGFIGGGSALGGAAGAGAADLFAKPLGTNNLLLISAALLSLCAWIVWIIVARKGAEHVPDTADDYGEKVGGLDVVRFLRQSKHLRLIALVVSFAAIGGAIVEQQLNMAAGELVKEEDAITKFLARVTVYISLIGFAIQVGATSRIHRKLGLAFALVILPASLSGTGVLMLFMPVLWAPALARILDSALRYSVDKTTREILFLPLPLDLKYRAKPFIDVAVDRFAKGVGAALVLLIAIKVFHLTWSQLSYVSLLVGGLWIALAFRARKQYLVSFREVLAAVPQGNLAPLEPPDKPLPPERIEPAIEEASRDYRRYHAMLGVLVQDPRAAPVVAALKDALQKRRTEIFQILMQVHTRDDIEAARRALESVDPAARARGAEYLDNALPRPIRRQVVPVLELSLDPREAAKRNNPEGGDDFVPVLRELAKDPDPSLAAAAGATAASATP